MALSGTVALPCLSAAVISRFGSSGTQTAAQIGDHWTARDRTSLSAETMIVDARAATAVPHSSICPTRP